MTPIRYYLNGTECNPVDKERISYLFDFTSRKIRELELSVQEVEFVMEDKTAIEQWILTYGHYVGMPLTVQYSNGVTREYILDFASEGFEVRDNSIVVPIKLFKGTDNFFDRANGSSFEIIPFQPSDFVDVDYIVVREEQFGYYIGLTLATYTLTKELITAIQNVAEGISDIQEASIPSISAAGVPVINIPLIVSASIKLVARIAYTIAIAIALIKLITEILNAISPKVRQFKAITYKRLIEVGCNFLGFTLQSQLLNQLGNNLVVLPVPLREKDPSFFKELFFPASLAFTKGYPSGRDTIPTLGGAIDAIETIFNARTKVVGGVVQIEKESTFEQQAGQNITLAFNIQQQIENSNGINAVENFKRLLCKYQVDGTDINTFDDTKKSIYEISSEVVVSPGSEYELIKGFEPVDIPFARGTRKNELTFVESIAKALAGAVDLFTGGNLSSKIEARKGCLQISSQYFSTTKLLWMNGTKLSAQQNNFIGCEAIITNYHSDKYIQNNQKSVYLQMPIALNESELFNLLQNNFVILDNGQTAEILRIDWMEETRLASVDYTINKSAVNEQTIVINNGG